MIGIYAIKLIIDNKLYKIYIGQSVYIEERWRTEKGKLSRKDKGMNKHLQSAWDKYGIDKFIFEVIEECNKEELTNKEQYWIEYYRNQLGIKYIFNQRIACDSNKGYKYPPEFSIIMSEATKGQKNPFFGKTHSKESRNKISVAGKGRKITEETRKKLKGRVPWNKDKRGCFSPEGIKKMSDKKLGKHVLKNCKTFEFISPEKKYFLVTTGLKYFCKLYNLSISSMSRVHSGKAKQHKGWTAVHSEFKSRKGKKYIFISPENKVVNFQNMTEFCKKNNLNRTCMHRIINGERKNHKNWKLVN